MWWGILTKSHRGKNITVQIWQSEPVAETSRHMYISMCIHVYVKFPFLLFCCSELPHPPRSLTAHLNDSDSRSVLLSWLRPFDGNSPLLHYVLELSENSMFCLFFACQDILYSPPVVNSCSSAVYQALTLTNLKMLTYGQCCRTCTLSLLINKAWFSALPYHRSFSRSLSNSSSAPQMFKQQASSLSNEE